ncbi:WAP four-disulfide core domain protein 1 [Folsomia candida]|uniref:WAP four-disulfide core domain protein 1 n=1 Tax=Folsomia candida TaxID=158441 RepID=A0A226EI41_FOLCA|nr:WAP four-disulfide core domain protein 1 [Folsomia candida]
MFSDVKCCTFILLLLISYSCVEARIISNSEYGENVNDESINSEILDNTVYENWYDYYDEALLEEYAGPVVVDLDKYMTGDDIHNNYDDYYTTNIDEMRSPSAIKFDLSCPDLPSYPAEHRLKQCLAKTCRSNADCELVSNWSTSSMQQDRVCCFNGCVSTCLPKMYPPKAFDWVDEIELPIQKSNSNAGKLKSLSILSASEDYSSMDTIVLPGGCVITAFQLQELQMFRKHGHVDTCTCTDAEVVCQVKT